MSRAIEQGLKEHFISMGLEEVPHKSRKMTKTRLLFKDESSLTVVRLVSKDDLSNRNVLLQVILELGENELKANRRYLALPKSYGAAFDGSLLRDRGLGLLLCDEEGVREVIPAEFITPEIPSATMDELVALRADLSELRRLYSELSKEVSKTNNELLMLKRKMQRVESEAERTKATPDVSTKTELVLETGRHQDDGMPTFFLDNPWLKVLSRRGEDDDNRGHIDE